MIKTLLPPGCYDVLPPHAHAESLLSSRILDIFAAYGYEQVAPPLLEYSDHLLAGRGAALSSQMFRVMDPTAHRVMAVRPDITLQIARIASGPLAHAPRPLRLCYNGLILRLQGEQIKPNRQLRQAGIELIGSASTQADIEIMTIAMRTLVAAGISEFTLDVNLPGMVAAVTAQDALTEQQAEALASALAHKDAQAIANLPLAYKDALVALIEQTGPAIQAMKAIQALTLPDAAQALCHTLANVVELLESRKEPGCTLTLDVTEHQGFAYHSGVGFTLFVPGIAHEVGRGGRYRIGNEDATGFTLYVESLQPILPPAPTRPKVLVEGSAAKATLEKLQSEGYATLLALTNNLKQEATELACTHIYDKGKLHSL